MYRDKIKKYMGREGVVWRAKIYKTLYRGSNVLGHEIYLYRDKNGDSFIGGKNLQKNWMR